MANDREPRRWRMDRRVLVAAAIVVVVVLALFLFFDFGYRTAPDTTSGGPDARYSAPMETEETRPTTPQDE
ncbi:hypothetical protein [Chelativorans sp. M5D2P16]|uniref:hypothetical protein n=1 Tax=Chelativorans sp. M5D2P16 TaxID=3095678 RepID=UPI002ACA0BB4|nr:hypothetical protein [Chelativorans sp. M5D2P16]MDZ5697008.1 hypothetical protein [Chelativorans sp. M5D2P16]